MSEQKSYKRLQSRNRSHGKGLARDVLPPVAEDNSPLSRSLDELLLVKPAPIMSKHATKSLDAASRQSEVQESSSNDSFTSAKSKTSELELTDYFQMTEVPFENILPSECMLNPELTNETVPSYDEDMFQVDTLPLNEDDCDKNVDVTDIVNSILKNAVDEESDELVMTKDSLELASAVSAATTSQALIEALVEDSDIQINELVRIRDEEELTNKLLKRQVQDYEQMKDRIVHLTQDLETTYSQTYAELQLTQEKEMEVAKLEATREKIILKKELEDIKEKFSTAQAELATKSLVEAELNQKIINLENILREKEKHCKEELQGVIAKLMKSELITLSKNEIEEELLAEKKKKGGKFGEANDFFGETNFLVSQTPTEGSNDFSFQTPPKRRKTQRFSDDKTDLDAMIRELKKLCDEKERDLIKIQTVNVNFGAEIKQLQKLSNGKQRNLENLQFSYDALKTEMDEIRKELADSQKEQSSLLLDQETHKNSLITHYEECAKELEKLQNENTFFQTSAQDIENGLAEKIKSLSVIIKERDQLFSEEKLVYEKTNMRMTELESQNVTLQNLLEKINEEMASVVDEKDKLLIKQVALEATLVELRAERETLMSKNKELLHLPNWSLLDISKRSSFEAELHKMQGQFSCDPKGSQFLNWSKATDSTQYMDFIAPVPSDVGCQTEASKRLGNLEQDLSNCWTERCELEQEFAAVLAENAALRQHTALIDTVSQRALILAETVPSSDMWLQFRSCFKEIVDEVSALLDSANNGKFIKEQNQHQITPTIIQNSFLPNAHGEIQERSSPEGGRGTPQPTDCLDHLPIVDYYDNDSSSRADEVVRKQDQSSNALLELVGELMRCLNSEESTCNVTNATNDSINASFAERLAGMADAGELCRVFQQIKDEVTRLFAMSQQADSLISKLQDENHSLQLQVTAADKQARSTLAFLDEQAAERELERDEASKQIQELTELLRNKDRQLSSKELIAQDIESLEQQLMEAQTGFQSESAKRQAMEEKMQVTLKKVGSLREVIQALESQLLVKSEELETAQMDNVRLQRNLFQTGQRSLEMENAQKDSFSESLAYTARLEDELLTLRHKFEAVGPESLATARSVIKELEIVVARRTRDLELVQVAWSGGLSSASEEISTRDHVDATRCVTPDEMALEASAGLCEDVERLKERLVKHARVEEAALKKIKDLEQWAIKGEELQVDFEVAMRRMDCLMTENARLKTRIEEDRHKQLEKIVSIDLEAKINDLETQLEMIKEESLEDRKQLMEKCRREERLQTSLEACEADLSAETLTVKQLRERLKNEKSLRLAAEARETQEASIAKNLDSTGSYNLSSAPEKRTKFWAPHSFVADSLTPISHDDGSLLREAESVREAIPFDTLPHKSWKNHSPVAALQLSPRGFSILQSSPTGLDSSISFANVPALPPKEMFDSKMNDVSLIKATEKIKNLEDELKTTKIKMSRTCKEMELAKKIAEDALARVRVQAESAQKELELRKEELTRVNGCLKDVAVEAEVDKEQGLQLLAQMQQQLEIVKKQLKHNQRETLKLKKMLEDSHKELETIKTDRDTLGRREQELTNNKKELDEKVAQLEAQRQSQQIAFAECEKLKMEKELMTTQLSIRTQELESVQQDFELREEEILRLKSEREEVEIRVKAAYFKIEKLDVKIQTLQEKYSNVGRDLNGAVEEIESLKAYSHAQLTEIEELKMQNQKLERNSFQATTSFADISAVEERGDKERLEKLYVDAATLRACLKSSLSRSASLEAEVVLVRSDLENRESEVVSLESEIKGMRDKIDHLNQQVWENVHKIEDSTDCLGVEDAELMMAKLRAEDLAMNLEKVKAQLARSKTKEARLRATLEKAVEIGREGSNRETNLKKELETAEREIVRLKYLLDIENVATRGYERLHHHGVAAQRFNPQVYDPRSVRSAGDGEDRQAEWQWTIHRLESYRKALIWQKTYLQKSGSRAEPHRRRNQRISLRTVGFMVIAILRMRYLTRRWKSRLPPLISPPRRGERPLMLTSPPCKDTGFRVHQKM